MRDEQDGWGNGEIIGEMGIDERITIGLTRGKKVDVGMGVYGRIRISKKCKNPKPPPPTVKNCKV